MINIGWAGLGKVGMVEPHALVKLLLEKLVLAEAMEETLGRTCAHCKFGLQGGW